MTTPNDLTVRRGPFGLWMGMRVPDLGSSYQEIGNGLYRLEDVPTPHSAFEGYVLKVGPSAGLGWIKAVGKTIATNSYGTQLISAFDEM